MIKVFILQLIVNKTSIKSIGGNVLWYTIKFAKLQHFFVENGSRFQCHPYLVMRVFHFQAIDNCDLIAKYFVIRSLIELVIIIILQ